MSVLESNKANDEAEIKFAKLFSPKMKSVYWRHFGFPSNENNDIITKQNVVCMICHKVLTNHGNTTNLRAHLQHRHKELFQRICEENSINVPPRKKYTNHPPVTARNISSRRVKLEYVSLESKNRRSLLDTEHSVSNPETDIADEQNMLYESEMPITYEDAEEGVVDDVSEMAYTKLEIQSSDDQTEDNNVICIRKRRNISKNETIYKPISPSEKKISEMFIQNLPDFQVNDALINIIIEDIRNLDTLFEPGMLNFLRLFVGETLPTIEKLEHNIREQYFTKFEMQSQVIKLITHERYYSLGFEMWSNIEQKRFVTIYWNYISDEPPDTLINKMFTTVAYNEYISIAEYLNDFELQNCSGIVVNYEYDDVIKSFFKERGIPVLLAFDYVIEKCLQQVLSIQEVMTIVEQVKDVMLRCGTEINAKELDEIVRREDFLWTYFDWLKFFSESISWSDDMQSLVHQVKCITDVIGSLAVTLETLKGEDIPHISILAPVTTKVLSKILCVNDNDEAITMELKRTVREVLHQHIIKDMDLAIAALLDPRFHRLTQIDDIDSCVGIMKNRYNTITGYEENQNNNDAATSHTEGNAQNKSTSETKKSRLELFFDINYFPKTMSKPSESSLETDLKRYRNEVYVALHESPFQWWHKVGNAYATLQLLAPLYQCVPGVINLNFKKSLRQQISDYTKRSLLTGDLIDPILFLNFHK